jgi:hypothetical protein
MKSHIAFILFLAVVLSSCSIEKRVYQSGYYIFGRNSSNDDVDVAKETKPIVFEQAPTIEQASEAVVVPTEQHSTSTSTLPSNYSDSIIKDNNLSNIIQTNKILTRTYSDSIPDDGKVLLDKYEKNHKAKKKIREIGFFPAIVADLGLVMTLIFLIPWLFESLANDSLFFTFVFTFLFGLAMLIPLSIAYLILSIITKKQRRKLRRMGLVK